MKVNKITTTMGVLVLCGCILGGCGAGEDCSSPEAWVARWEVTAGSTTARYDFITSEVGIGAYGAVTTVQFARFPSSETPLDLGYRSDETLQMFDPYEKEELYQHSALAGLSAPASSYVVDGKPQRGTYIVLQRRYASCAHGDCDPEFGTPASPFALFKLGQSSTADKAVLSELDRALDYYAELATPVK